MLARFRSESLNSSFFASHLELLDLRRFPKPFLFKIEFINSSLVKMKCMFTAYRAFSSSSAVS